jgi:hypothetical protein
VTETGSTAGSRSRKDWTHPTRATDRQNTAADSFNLSIKTPLENRGLQARGGKTIVDSNQVGGPEAKKALGASASTFRAKKNKKNKKFSRRTTFASPKFEERG